MQFSCCLVSVSSISICLHLQRTFFCHSSFGSLFSGHPFLLYLALVITSSLVLGVLNARSVLFACLPSAYHSLHFDGCLLFCSSKKSASCGACCGVQMVEFRWERKKNEKKKKRMKGKTCQQERIYIPHCDVFKKKKTLLPGETSIIKLNCLVYVRSFISRCSSSSFLRFFAACVSRLRLNIVRFFWKGGCTSSVPIVGKFLRVSE